jgi:hypothetical protein
MKLQDQLSLSWRTAKSNRLRTGITIAIIAFGIMALIGIITAIEAMNQSLYENFSILGANSFTIRFKERKFRLGGPPKSDLTVSRKGSKQRLSILAVNKGDSGRNYAPVHQHNETRRIAFVRRQARMIWPQHGHSNRIMMDDPSAYERRNSFGPDAVFCSSFS